MNAVRERREIRSNAVMWSIIEHSTRFSAQTLNFLLLTPCFLIRLCYSMKEHTYELDKPLL